MADWTCAVEIAGRPGSERCKSQCSSCEGWFKPAPPLPDPPIRGEVIGLSGAYGAGKDAVFTFARAWAGARGRQVRREAFADRMKLSMARIFFPDIGLQDAIRWCNLMKEAGEVSCRRVGTAGTECIPWRMFMERFGTEAHRDVFGHDFWIDMALSTYVPPEILIVTDVHFKSEARAIHELGGQVWEILRPGCQPDEITHVVQEPLPREMVDDTIVNDSSLSDLGSTVFERLDSLVSTHDFHAVCM